MILFTKPHWELHVLIGESVIWDFKPIITSALKYGNVKSCIATIYIAVLYNIQYNIYYNSAWKGEWCTCKIYCNVTLSTYSYYRNNKHQETMKDVFQIRQQQFYLSWGGVSSRALYEG